MSPHLRVFGMFLCTQLCSTESTELLQVGNQGSIGSGVNVEDFDPKAPCSNPDEVAR